MVKTNLLPIDLAVLACVEHHADIEATEVAKRLKRPARVVQYSLSRMQERGVLSWSPFIDVYRFGLSYYGIYFSVNGTRSKKQALLESLIADKGIVWVAQLGGEFEFAVAICAEHAWEAPELFYGLTDRAKVEVTRKVISVRTMIADLPRRYLGCTTKSSKCFISKPTKNTVTLREMEERVLHVLAHEKFSSYRQAAAKAGMAVATFDYHLKRLREKEVLLGTQYLVDSRKLGREPYKLFVRTSGMKPGFYRTMYDYVLAKIPEAYHFVACFGAWDIEINVDLSGLPELTRIAQQFLEDFPTEVTEVRSSAVLKVHKLLRFPEGRVTRW